MSSFRIEYEWNSYDDSEREIGETTARFSIYVDNKCLTTNHDLFSKTVRDQIHVSLYPLAMWFASSWWRLHFEVLPNHASRPPSHDWRMSHEMAAANMGFIWPQIMFSADRNSVQVWSQASQNSEQQAVTFLNGFSAAHTISKEQFSYEISSLISDVVARLHEVGCKDTDLEMLWKLVLSDMDSPEEEQKRRIEAMLGFDPEECPQALAEKAISLKNTIGDENFSELAGAYAQEQTDRFDCIKRLLEGEGLEGRPNAIIDTGIVCDAEQPWATAVSSARKLRTAMGDAVSPIKSHELHELLGLSTDKLADWVPTSRAKAAVAGPCAHGKMKVIPRRAHLRSQRFELARLVGDYALVSEDSDETWLVSADLSTTRQKFQRAFAAEFLCPIASLSHFLGGDYSDGAIEEAATHFSVSERTVTSLLMNNGYIQALYEDGGLPYDIDA